MIARIAQVIASQLPQSIAIKVARTFQQIKSLLQYRDLMMFQQVFLEISVGCNRSCWYCPEQFKRWKQGMMTESLLGVCLSRLREIKFMGAVGFTIFNEPLQDPRLERIISQITQEVPGAIPILFTNGDLLTVERADLLVASGLKRCTITRHPPSSDKWEQQIRKVLTRHSKVFRLYEIKKPINVGGLVSGISFNPHTRCIAPTGALPIRYNGDIGPCCCDYDRTIIWGNIQDEGLLEIWRKFAFKEARKQLRKGIRPWTICQKCSGVQ